MSCPFLFGGNESGVSNKYLLEFKAGRLDLKESLLTADNRKGVCYMHQTGEDNLMHFCWKERDASEASEDYIIFPGDAEFIKLSNCNSGRVFALKFKEGRRCFFWMQEPSEDKDAEILKKVNELITSPPPKIAEIDTSNPRADSPVDLSSIVNSPNFPQIMQMLMNQEMSSSQRSSNTGESSGSKTGGSSPSAPSSPGAGMTVLGSKSSKPTASSNPIKLADFRNIIASLNPGAEEKDEEKKRDVDLSSIITCQALQTLVSNKEFMSRVSSYLPTVEESPDSSQSSTSDPTVNLSSTVQSPQFKQALRSFSSALQSRQLGPLVKEFGLTSACVDAANEGDVEKFVKALEKSEKRKRSKNTKEDNGEHERMSFK